MSAPHGDLMAHDHRASWPWHNMALWPRHDDNNEDMAVPASLMVHKNILNSLLQSLRIFKFMNIWPEMHWDWWWFEIFTNGRVPTIFMARGCAGWVVWTRREWGWVIESYQGPSRLLLSCPGSLQHCSNTHLDPAESISWGDLRGISGDKRMLGLH